MKVANGAQVLTHTGYVAGSVPPFGYRQPLRTLVDTAVRTQSGVIYGGGGDVNALLRLTVGELLRVVEGGIVNYEL
jgi:prolyl-tRNA editing enzyme YbaK/EbsC (Cys-tRNA(Pro) deacylase)